MGERTSEKAFFFCIKSEASHRLFCGLKEDAQEGDRGRAPVKRQNGFLLSIL